LLIMLVACNGHSKDTEIVTGDSTGATGINKQTLETVIVADTTNPEELINIIKRIQKKYVRESWGIYKEECFTDIDFEKFNNDGSLYEIKNSIENDRIFAVLIRRIEEMPLAQRADLLSRAENTYKKTWAALNLNPANSSREQLRAGQTEAGSNAERAIAEAVAGYVSREINQ
jgi:hypothetical protein